MLGDSYGLWLFFWDFKMLSYHFDPVIANSYKKITSIIKKNTMFPKKVVNILCEDCHHPKFSWEQSWILRKLINFLMILSPDLSYTHVWRIGGL